MVASSSPAPASGLELETTAEERSVWCKGRPRHFSIDARRRLLRDLTAAMQEIERLRAGWSSMFENELRWHDEAAENLARAESAEASARSARAEALEEAAKIADHDAWSERTIVEANISHPSVSVYERGGQIARGIAAAIRSLKTPQGDGEGK